MLNSRMLKRYPLFAGGSAIGAAIDYVVTLASSTLLKIEPNTALALAMTISASITFLFHDRVTFRGEQDNIRHRFLLFTLWSCFIYLIRALLLYAGLYAGLPLALVLLLAIGLVSIINFAMSSTVIFAKTRS
ncbi:putative flippase GtrA [Rhizobium sp. ERR 922]|uniref:GtrA family protein n=1 Tax=unclassified Rhizobium TaxID=2613769 RepID=UPI0011ADEB21|nr:MULTISPECIES: GtrA family protein [unclassified Rhizobium]TWB47350.1 putative flippase GtrA [Rhizobium sp. ERR 922]TWB91021.1 putative flippase GtrA [Rhizobium sp. ERR 942]